ncbi:MAG: DUF2752 domain-containing protein [Planctomycetota bacterium]|nr:DUF2752 domain-containing protein [Planctomycetota bacterium]
MVDEQPRRVSGTLFAVDPPRDRDTAEPPPLPPEPRPGGTTRRRDALALALLLGMFAAGALMEADATSAKLFGVEGPECPSRLVLPDHGCPGCGLTRATAMLLDGDAAGATRLHPGAWLVVLLGAAGTLLRAVLLVSPRNDEWIHRRLRSGRVLFLVGLLAIWLARLA